ncbi:MULTISPECIES: formyltetrahydrofolate deformylase [unclassified Nesterenkonia]|uniref:formyltetrahydrofolate deformylase n=1 Tax=unclassified Nesterenkonia TaxID=2629769 RepID=UPI000872AE31|nr:MULTISPECIES: formyltetrahydrofolate deformylase [unclassified Nesterenkonia]MDS2172599.1 formyltetrahydrofolate deformylase [Nesterenkonia sp. CL21]OSM44162.1 formyltetrahydrofolate deformylase [Nesterenkonia sp. PF2B19]
MPSDRGMILTLDCPSTLGIVHAVSEVLLAHGCNIMELAQFNDPRAGRFFLRARAESGDPDDAAAALAAVEADLAPVAERFGMNWSLRAADAKPRVLVMVSKFEHCLNDLLFRTRKGDLPIEIVAVVSNHPDHQRLVEWHDVPFVHIPVTPETKPQAEQQLLDLVDRLEIDLVVLARYMQILSDSLATRMEGRVINIHHSFLPSFKGAKPYHQAFERGVKTVGATAHYVNSELDEGPIIAQQVLDVDHTHGPEDLVAAGRDTECKALSDAVRWHAEGRVILHGGKTVVLR